MPRQMGCTASGKGNEKKRQGWYVFIKSGSDDDEEDGSPAGGARSVVSKERNDLSTKLDVKVERCSRHCGPRDVGNSYRSSTCL